MFFVSPSFPNINNAQFDCTWRLQAPEGMRVKIRWPVFHLDSCGSKNMLNTPGDQSSRKSSENKMLPFCLDKFLIDSISELRKKSDRFWRKSGNRIRRRNLLRKEHSSAVYFYFQRFAHPSNATITGAWKGSQNHVRLHSDENAFIEYPRQSGFRWSG